jgi:hypothetical protein
MIAVIPGDTNLAQLYPVYVDELRGDIRCIVSRYTLQVATLSLRLTFSLVRNLKSKEKS